MHLLQRSEALQIVSTSTAIALAAGLSPWASFWGYSLYEALGKPSCMAENPLGPSWAARNAGNNGLLRAEFALPLQCQARTPFSRPREAVLLGWRPPPCSSPTTAGGGGRRQPQPHRTLPAAGWMASVEARPAAGDGSTEEQQKNQQLLLGPAAAAMPRADTDVAAAELQPGSAPASAAEAGGNATDNSSPASSSKVGSADILVPARCAGAG